jgi:OmpA-OmpF porin, OOP family
MSTFMKWLVMLLIWLAFSLATFRFCVKEACCDECVRTETVAPVPAETSVPRYPIDFQWDDAQAYTNDGFAAIRDRLVAEMGDNNSLVITGKYFASEKAPEGYSSMGLARATQLRDMLAPYISPDRIKLADLRLDDTESVKTGYFEAVDFEWRANDAKEATEVIELANKVIIRFPYSSAVKEADSTVDEYLDKLATRLQKTTERVKITGHTDDRGPEAGNLKLSERRAKFIRDVLVKKGVATDRMDIEWKGESDPTSSNDTEEGRHNNRRVELQILQAN